MTPPPTISDPTYGYTLATLLQVPYPPPPPDFADFWQQTRAAALALSPRLTTRHLATHRHVDVHEIEFDGLSQPNPDSSPLRGSPQGAISSRFRVGGWLTVPRDQPIHRGFIISHGYGGRDAPDLLPLAPNSISIFPCARGFHRSARPDLPADASIHVLHGIQSRETYLHRFCTADLFSATSALLEFAPSAAPNLAYVGESFGGGIGAVAIAFESRWQRAWLNIPSFGNYPLRLSLPCTGSGHYVTECAKQHPEILNTLAYFDAASAASLTTIPTLITPALSDPAVPPPGQFSIHNALPNKQLLPWSTGHSDNPNALPESRRIHEKLAHFFNP